MGNNAPSPVYPLFQARFGFSTGDVTVIFAAVVVGVVPSLLFLGPLSDRIGRRPVLLLALAFAGLGSLCFTLAQGLGGLVAARVLQGLAFGALSGAAVAALIELEPHSDHARATLTATVTIVVSQAVGPLASGLLAQYGPDPTRLSFILLTGLLAFSLASIVTVPETVDRAGGGTAETSRLPRVPPGVGATFATAALAVAAAFAALGLIAALGPTFVAGLLHIDNRAVGGAVVFAMLGTSAAVQIRDRRGSTSTQLTRGAGLLALGIAVVGAGIAAGSAWLFVGGILVAGAGQGLAYLGAQTLLDRCLDEHDRGAAMSAFFLVLYLAAALAALAVGLSAGAIGLRVATILGTAAIVALSLASLLRTGRFLSDAA